ncbi:MAG TPA: PAS domain-containing protein [Chitinophagaceae bacterium]|nr:PAS domain-containing protein [Chitinophagaceae bacterium]
MRKIGVSITLPSFINESHKYPAFVINIEGKILAANNLFKKIFNVAETGSIFINDIFTDNSFSAFYNQAQGITSGKPLTLQSSVDAQDICWEISGYEQNNFICTGSATQAPKNILTYQKPFSIFFDNSPALMWATDKEGRMRMMNKRFKEHTGFTEKQIGCLLWDIFPKEMADDFKKNNDVVLERNELIEVEEISVDKSGAKRNYLAYKFPLQTEQDGVLIAGCSIDITDVLEKTEQLHYQSHLLDSIEQAVYILDPAQKVIYWSKYAEKMFGWRREEILHKSVAVLTPHGVLNEDIANRLRGKQSWHGEIDLKRKDGSIIQVHATKSPVVDNENNVTAYIGISKDISESKIVHKKLVKQNNQFRQIARLQSHAVRRPLANMLGLIDLIQYYADKKEFEEILYMVSMLKQSSEDLDDIIRRIVLKAGVYFDPALRIA